VKRILLIVFILINTTLYAMTQKLSDENKKIDDWEYNATKTYIGKKHSRGPMMVSSSPPMLKTMGVSRKNLGFSVGGAKDADNFYENIKNGYLPKIDSITYEGVFYDHYFDVEDQKKCENLFCPSYTTAIQNNIFTSQKEYFLSVGLNSNIKESDFKRKKLNIVVVLDISGSMNSSFDKYYYNRGKKTDTKENNKLSKMAIANNSIVSMIDHLKDDDKLGVVLFDNTSYNAKPLREIDLTNIEATKKHILKLEPRGGTNWSAGYKAGLKLFESLNSQLKNPSIYENRIIFLTDAMPNMGELGKDKLFGPVKNASERNIYTSFIGIGVDFNNDLVEHISKTRGANYYAVHSAKEFKKRLDNEFDYMVTPLVFDLKMKLKSNSYKIVAVYGSPDASKTTGDIMYINTLFPSKNTEEGTKGGVVLLKLKKLNDNKDDILLELSYKDRDLKIYKNTQKIAFTKTIHYENRSIQKAILLSEYVDLIKNYLIDTRASCNDEVHNGVIKPLMKRCMLYPPDRPEFAYIKTWERKSCPLKVTDGYKKIFSLFKNHFKSNMKQLDDKSLQKELNLLKTLISQKEVINRDDDWQTKR
jgi:Ca-activated chloride channel family protein